MRARSLSALLFLGLLACGGDSDESPVPKQPPSAVARLAAQACACTTLECLTPLREQIARIISSQHASGNSIQDNAEATNKVAQCASRLAGK